MLAALKKISEMPNESRTSRSMWTIRHLRRQSKRPSRKIAASGSQT